MAREKWITKGLLKSSQTKGKLYKKAINKDKNHEANKRYVRYRNKFNNIKRLMKANYYAEELEANKHNMKNTWKIMKTAMNKLNDKSNISQIIKFNNNTLTDNQEIRNAFCEYFTNVGQDYAHKIPKTHKTPCHYLKGKLNNTIYLNPTDQNY